MGGVAKRTIEVGTDTCLLGFSGRDYIKSAAFDASTLSPVGGVSEQQVLTLTGSPSGGTFKLKYRGQETSSLTHDESAADIQTALRALSNIGSTGVTVSGSAGGPWTVTFGGPLANTDVFMLQLGTNALTGGTSPSLTVVQSVAGVTYDPRILVGSASKPGTLVTLTGSAPKKKVKEYTGAGGVAEVQTATVTGTPSGGTFRIGYRGGETVNIAHNASASTVQTALNDVDTVDEDGGVTVSGSAGGPWTITFNVKGVRPIMSLGTNALTGGSTPSVSFAETTPGANPEAIWGVIDGVEEFITNSSAGDRDINVYRTQCVFDARKIKDFSTHETAFRAWCREQFNTIGRTA